MPDETVLEMTADILGRAEPALSATSDMPAAEAAETVATEAPNAEPTETAAETPAEGAEGEAGAEGTEDQEAAVETAKRPDPRTTRIKSLEAQTETLQGELSKALDAIKQLTQPKEPEAPPERAARTPEPRPTREQFDSPDDYTDALVAWSAREAALGAIEQADASRIEREQEAARLRNADAVTQQATETAAQWSRRRSSFIEAHPDYETVAESDGVPINDPMAQIISTHDQGPAIAYWLGQNPKEAARIAAATPFQPIPQGATQAQASRIAAQNVRSLMQAGIELGRVSALLGGTATAPAPEISKAPPPIRPIGGSSERAAERSADEMSGDEYFDSRIDSYRSHRRPSGVGRMMN